MLDRQIRVIEQPDSPLWKTTSYTYDPCGRVKTITKPSGTVLTHAYDALGRLIELTSSDNSVSYSYTYDLNNNPLQVKDNNSGIVTQRAYDSWNRLTEDGIEGVHTSKYAYDAIGRLISLSEPDNSSILYSYDNAYLSMVERLSKEGVKCYSHQYVNFDKNGRVVESKLINNLGKAHFAYDKKGRNTSTTTNYYSHSIPEEGYDAIGNLKIYHATDPVGIFTVTCTYDDLYQLTSESGLHNHIYAHDSLHNRLSKNETIYDVDILNKITSDGAANFSYDQNGNLLSDGKNSCRYDALDRLIEANGIRYVYDSFNRRIMRNDTYFLYHGLREVGTFENGKIKEFRVLGLGKRAELGASIAIELDGSVYCPIHDFRGNIVALIDESGQPAETYRYTAFGECEVLSHSSTLHNSWRFASKRYDPETGFTYFLRRYYNSTHGRWVTPDPIGFADGPNIYAYNRNNPLTLFDLYGLYALDASGNLSFNGKIEKEHRSTEELHSLRDNRRYRPIDYSNFHGPFPEKSFHFKIGSQPLAKGAIGHTNGIANSPTDAMQRVRQLSDIAGEVAVDGIYNKTHTLPVDAAECFICHFGIKSTPAQLLLQRWDNLINTSPPDMKFLESCHSGGADHLKNALMASPKDVRERIIVLAIAPSVIIPKSICYESSNYMSERDFVTHLDVYGKMRYGNELKILKAHPDAPFWDHDFLSPTFDEVKEKAINNYIKMYGKN